MKFQSVLAACLLTVSSCSYGGGTSGTGLTISDRAVGSSRGSEAAISVAVSGILYGKAGKPLGGADITVETVRSAETAKTDSLGRFSLPVEAAAGDKLSVSVSAGDVGSSADVAIPPLAPKVRLVVRINKNGTLSVVLK